MSQQTIQFDIPDSTTDIVVFVHGFGVRWDSRGMFTDIQASLPKRWGSVLFDFYKIEGHDAYITPIQEQIEHLQAVLYEASQRCPDAKIHVIAHSMGCIIAALTEPEISGKVIFLAPPESFGTRMEKYFKKYPGAMLAKDELSIPRKDGTTTHVPLNFFEQTAAIDAEGAMYAYGKQRSIYLVQTTEDEVISETQYEKLQTCENIHIQKIAADHNFTKNHRREIIALLHNILMV